jgi:hypothetical protein
MPYSSWILTEIASLPGGILTRDVRGIRSGNQRDERLASGVAVHCPPDDLNLMHARR